jgi:glc operon protein GlcG
MQQIAEWLEKLGMSEYAQRFAENGVDVSVLPHLTDQDLKDIGVLLGHRRKMLAAIADLDNTAAVAVSSPVSLSVPPVEAVILDSGGNMVMFHKLDNTQLASIGVSEGKANTALRFKRPSKALDDVIAAGGAGLRLLAVKDITPLEGGLPVILDGTIIGAIGVSGALSSQDAQVARAGVAAVVK